MWYLVVRLGVDVRLGLVVRVDLTVRLLAEW